MTTTTILTIVKTVYDAIFSFFSLKEKYKDEGKDEVIEELQKAELERKLKQLEITKNVMNEIEKEKAKPFETLTEESLKALRERTKGKE